MDAVRVGVIGCGYWGPNLIRNFVELQDSDVVLISDLDEARLASVQARYPDVEVTTDYRDLFKNGLDAVVVATPPPTHFPIALDCLTNGLHTLVEKPLTLKSEHAVQLIDCAEQNDLTLMVGHTFEYNSAVREMKQIIDSGALGEIYCVDTVRVNLGLFQKELNVVWDLAPHDISILRYILGAEPLHVHACGAAHIFPDVYNLAYLYLQFPNNVIGHIHVSWLDPCKVRRITVVGSEKMLVYDDVEPLEKIRIYDKGVDTLSYPQTYADFQLSYRYGAITIPHIKFVEPLRVECQHFLDSIKNGTRPQSDGHNGLQVVKVLERAEQSLCNGSIKPGEGQPHDYAAVYPNA